MCSLPKLISIPMTTWSFVESFQHLLKGKHWRGTRDSLPDPLTALTPLSNALVPSIRRVDCTTWHLKPWLVYARQMMSHSVNLQTGLVESLSKSGISILRWLYTPCCWPYDLTSLLIVYARNLLAAWTSCVNKPKGTFR